MNFWASYCEPCRRELPALQALHDSPASTVVAISVAAPTEFETEHAALRQARATFPDRYLSMESVDNEGTLDEVVDLLKLPIPTTLVIAPDGTLKGVIQGSVRQRSAR